MDALDASLPSLFDEVAELVQIPSVSGSVAENEIQHVLADRLGRTGFDVDHWQLDLDELRSDPDFPGMEVDRTEAWGLVGQVAGSGHGPTLMLNGHVDVVPTATTAPGRRHRSPPSGALIASMVVVPAT